VSKILRAIGSAVASRVNDFAAHQRDENRSRSEK
jgi:hypothetical protein